MQSYTKKRHDDLLREIELLQGEKNSLERQLLDRDEFFQDIIDNIPSLVGYWTVNLKCVFSNRAYQEWFGRTKEEMKGIYLQDLAGPELFKEREPYLRAALRGEYQSFEGSLKKANGEIIYLWLQFIPHKRKGRVVGIYGLISDITTVRRDQERLRVSDAALKAISEGVAIIRSDLRIMMINEAMTDITGYSQNELIGTPYSILHGEATDADNAQQIHMALEEGTSFSCRILHFRKDTSSFWNEISISPVRDKDGTIICSVCINRDITKQKYLEDQVAQKLAEEQLRLLEKERIESMLRQWMADSSHELRTPMTVLRAQIEAMQDGIFALDPRRLDILHNEVMGMTRLIEDLFLLARSDSGQLKCRSDSVDLFDLLDSVADAFRLRYMNSGLTITWNNATQGKPLVAGDEARIRQVLSNLLENSLRYTDKGGRLEITCLSSERDLILYFDDSAPGVPDASLQFLFDRFYRVDHSRGRVSGGSGLGLALCRTLIEEQGGTITAAHSPLGGLRIAISLPQLKHT